MDRRLRQTGSANQQIQLPATDDEHHVCLRFIEKTVRYSGADNDLSLTVMREEYWSVTDESQGSVGFSIRNANDWARGSNPAGYTPVVVLKISCSKYRLPEYRTRIIRKRVAC